MNRSGKIHFDRTQVDYLIKKTGEEDPHKAVEIFAAIIRDFRIDPMKMHQYLKRLMEMDEAANARGK